MEFCSKCESLMTLAAAEAGEPLRWQCPYCFHDVPMCLGRDKVSSETFVMSKTHSKRTDLYKSTVLNRFSPEDSTLPTITGASLCARCGGDSARYAVYDSDALSFAYQCARCAHCWTSK